MIKRGPFFADAQFLRRRTDTLTTRELKQANVGSKDKQVSIFKVWEAIFTREQKTGTMIGRRKGMPFAGARRDWLSGSDVFLHRMRTQAWYTWRPLHSGSCPSILWHTMHVLRCSIAQRHPPTGDGESGAPSHDDKLRILIGQNGEYDKIVKGAYCLPMTLRFGVKQCLFIDIITSKGLIP